jgi:hypothetical protein
MIPCSSRDLMSIVKNVKALFGDSSSNGDLFGEYVRELFPENAFVIVRVTQKGPNGGIIEQSFEPDFRFRHQPTNDMIWVVPQFRSQLEDRKIQLLERCQLDEFKEFQEQNRPDKMYIVIGFGGRPSKPHSLYSIPLEQIQYPSMFPYLIEKYRRPTNKAFWYQSGRLI